jgi:hypothetical protein
VMVTPQLLQLLFAPDALTQLGIRVLPGPGARNIAVVDQGLLEQPAAEAARPHQD